MATFFPKLALASAMVTAATLPASAQTYVAVIWGTELVHYFASPGDTSYLGDTESGMHLCAASRPVIYDNSRYAQFFLPNGRPIYTFWTWAVGAFTLDPANDKKCQARAAQYAQASGLPVQNVPGGSQTTVKHPVPDDASSQPASTASPAVMATATKNLANGFHDYETTKKVADDAPFEIVRNTWDPTTLTLTALDTKVVYHEIVINRGNCSAYISNTDINYKFTYDKLHDFYFGKYGDHILIQALNSREPHLSYEEQSSARVCEVLEVELRTSEGVSKYSFIQ